MKDKDFDLEACVGEVSLNMKHETFHKIYNVYKWDVVSGWVWSFG